jgi:cobalamin biosynthesis protein CbiG
MDGNQAMIVAGIGCRLECPEADISAVLRDAEARAGVTATALAAPKFKSTEPGLNAAAATLGLPLHWIDDAALAAAQPRCVTQSERVRAATGHAAIAEAAALAAAGPHSRLILPRIAHSSATCALAESNPA